MSTVKLRIGPADHGRRMTLEEFRDAEEEEGYRYELARGVLEVSEVPNDSHGQIVHNLHDAVTWYRHQHPGLIRRVGGAGEFRLWVDAMSSGRNPDLAIVFEGTPKDKRGRRRPSWVAEVVSKRGEDRDYVAKREEYLTFGIQEYWIIDPQLGQVTVLTRRDLGAPDWSEQVFTGEDVIVSALLPGFQGRVSELWINAELDEEDGMDELGE
jgi:Uma2 family endonuclease